MSFGREALEARRESLVRRSAELRGTIVANGAAVGSKLAAADRIVSAVRSHPVLVMLATTVAAGVLPKVLPAWLARAMMLYSFLKRL